MHKYLGLIFSSICVAASLFLGEGYSPFFAFLVFLPFSGGMTAVFAYCAWCFLRYLFLWSQAGTFSTVLFQLVMLFIGQIGLFLLPALSSWLRRFKLPLVVTSILLSTFYWWFSNSICFIQMSGLVPSWKFYDFSFSGYLTCLFSGGSFYYHSVVATLVVHFIFLSLKVLDESISFSRWRKSSTCLNQN